VSRIAKKPVAIPDGVQVAIEGRTVRASGPKGEGSVAVHDLVSFERNGDCIEFSAAAGGMAMAGTMRSLVGNLMTGVSEGFRRKLELQGVGYRAQMQGGRLNLQLGYSHPVEYAFDDSVTIQTPSQTEIVVEGVDKQKVGQVAAEIRALRAPEPYKGKGVRYAGEQVRRKEAKKK